MPKIGEPLDPFGDGQGGFQLRNAYQVLLTRARRGMVIFVPPGDQRDPTRSPAFNEQSFTRGPVGIEDTSMLLPPQLSSSR